MAKTESKDLNNLESLLECPLCMGLICEPITIPCGHTFCRVCLVNSLIRHKKKCPTCRAVCHVSAETAEENMMIKSICVTLFSDLYNVRLKECESEREQWSTILPIFYYNDCQFPGHILRLHLFEPRYKLMMQRVVHANRCFAYVPTFTNYQAVVGDVALVACITEVEFMSDGRCLVEARLTERKLIIDHYVEDGTQGLHFCRVEPLRDEPCGYRHGGEIDPSAAARLNAALQVCRNITNKIMSQSDSRRQVEANIGPPPPDTDPEGFSLWLCSLSSANSASKRNWLKMTSTVDRLEGVMASFYTHAAESSVAPTSSSPRSREENSENERNDNAQAQSQTDISQPGNDDSEESDDDGQYTGGRNPPFAPTYSAAVAIASSGPVAGRGSARNSSEIHSD